MLKLLKKLFSKKPSFLNMFPKSLSEDVNAVAKIIPSTNIPPLYGEEILIDEEHIQTYYRIYLEEPNPVDYEKLTNDQKLILNCIYSRHFDGFIREKQLRALLSNQKSWTIPYIVMLLGEYVIEIFDPIKKDLEEGSSQEFYRKFVAENPAFWNKTKARIISYWNEYYRGEYKNIEAYPGTEIIKIIERNKIL